MRSPILLFVLLTSLALTAGCRPCALRDLRGGDPGFPARNHPLAGGGANPLVRALRDAGLDAASLRLDPQILAARGADRFRTRHYDLYQSRPLEIPYLLSHARAAALEKPASLHLQMNQLLGRVDAPIRNSLSEPGPLDAVRRRLAAHPAPLAATVLQLCATTSPSLPAGEAERLAAEAACVPRPVQEAAALILEAALHAAERTRLATRQMPQAADRGFANRVLRSLAAGEADAVLEIEERAARTDFVSLYAGCQEVALATDLALESLGDRPSTASFAFAWSTPLGSILLRSNRIPPGGPHASDPVLLEMDLDARDDRHPGGAAALSARQPVSVLLDFGGDDSYEAENGIGPGTGVFGCGILVDLGGNDTYRCPGPGLGCGIFGFGALVDRAGDDRYEAVALAEGAGVFGLGLLADLAGNDRYEAYTLAQGLGCTLGAGTLLDLGGGDDAYLLKNDRVLFPSAQAPGTHNASLGQGCGLGRRADLGDGHSQAGGYGLLLDAGGDDIYEAAVLAQGAGYWYGMGFLLDLGGNDTYRAHWYCQGAAAHQGIGALIDYAGDDRYRCTAQGAQGIGHDWSVGLFVDAAGNDLYETGNLSLGAGNENGIGLFLDVRGDDHYRIGVPGAWSLGAARLTKWGSLRENLLNAGLFLDCGGRDSYGPHARELGGRNGGRWRGTRDSPVPGLRSQVGLGRDAETHGICPLRLEPWTESPDRGAAAASR